MNERIPTVGVLGSGKDPLSEYSEPLARLIATKGCNLVTGGGGGVMLAASAAFTAVQERRGVCFGVIPTEPDPQCGFRAKEGYPNSSVEVCVLSPLSVFRGDDAEQISRNHIIVLTGDVLIALPGSKGTQNEVNLAVRFGKPIALFGPEKAFDDFASVPHRYTQLTEVERFIDETIGRTW